MIYIYRISGNFTYMRIGQLCLIMPLIKSLLNLFQITLTLWLISNIQTCILQSHYNIMT